jgi:dTDP-4-amino-4,6-dideoxygalactose transaminase
MIVPFVNLKSQYQEIGPELRFAMNEVLESTAFAGGPYVAGFEEEFARFCGCQYAIGVGSGTEALWLTLLGLGIGPGDEVITVPNTFIATAEAITYAGAKPVFVDVEETSYNMNPDLLERAITGRTKAILPVHLYGQSADMDPIYEVANRFGLDVIEDACQAHGAEYKGRKAGSLGIAGCFSFYPGKNLGAYGEAGAVTTNSDGLRRRIATLRDHGQSRKYVHELVGWNCRMDGIQGAVLRVKLKYLAQANEARRKHAALYRELLKDLPGVLLPREMPYARHVYHLFVVRVKNRDEVLQALARRGISCGIHYPIPLHLQEAYDSMALGSGSFPVAESCAREILSLPMFPELSGEQIHHVASELKAAVASAKSELAGAAA